MLRFLSFRLLQSIFVLWTVFTVTFVLLMLAPGDPFIGEKKPPDSVIRALAQTYGLDYLAKTPEERKNMPWWQHVSQIARAYANSIRNALKGNLGPSIEYPNFSVTDIIRTSLPVSAALGSLALVIALWLGVATGTLAAAHKGRALDLILSIATLMGVSLPTFVIGALLMMLFVVYIPLFPAAGWGKPSQILLPAFTLSLFFLAYIARLARSSTLDALSADFVRTARAKGLSAPRVITHHVGANAALPILSYLGPAAANILTGSFVVEKLFAIPGLGTHFVNGCLNKDIPLVLGAVIVYTLIVVAFNLLVDLAYAAVDPRITLR
ncbi:MAG: ABC transporter permease [Phycisphaerales bacterium]|nr:ABC transporter permease [Phycisphaerales bacterium]